MPDADNNEPSIKITHRHDRSFLMFAMHSLVRPFKGKVVKLGEPYPGGSVKLEPTKRARKKVDCQERMVEDVRIYDFVPKQDDGKEKQTVIKKRIYYFAGGGWQSPPTGEHWALLTEMATRVPQTAVSLVSYPLAPHSPAPETFPKLLRLYRRVLAEAAEAGEEIILAGDSAGGNIVLCLAVNALLEDEANGQEMPCPKALFAMCPSTDMRRSNPDMSRLERLDPLLRIPFVKDTADAWCGDWDASDVRVSPLLADLTPLAKRGIQVHGITARYDILSLDAVLFRDKLSELGVKGEWLDWEKQMHCFPLAFAFHLRESVEGKDWILDVLRRV